MKYLFTLLIGGLAVFAYLFFSRTQIERTSGSPDGQSSELEGQSASNTAGSLVPSRQLGKFMDAHLDKMLLSLRADPKAVVDRPQVEIARMQAAFAAALAKAPPAKKPTYQVAVTICNTLSQAISEREQMQANYLSVKQVHAWRSLQEPDKAYDFMNSKSAERWDQRATQLRQSILNLYSRLHTLEAQAESPQ